MNESILLTDFHSIFLYYSQTPLARISKIMPPKLRTALISSFLLKIVFKDEIWGIFDFASFELLYPF